MRETEILRGLGKARDKARQNKFATGLVPLTPLQQATAEYQARNAAPVAPAPVSTMQRVSNGLRAADNFVSGIGPAVASAFKPQGIPSVDAGLRSAGAFARGTAEIHGPGTSTSDSIHGVSLSDGEAVLPAKTVQAVGPQNLKRLIMATNGKAPKSGLRAAHFAVGEVPELTSSLGADGHPSNTSLGSGGTAQRSLPDVNDGSTSPLRSNASFNVNDPIARAAQNRVASPTVAPEPVAPASPSVAPKPIAPLEAPANPGIVDSVKSGAQGAWDYAKNKVGLGGAPEAAVAEPAAASSWLKPAGAGFGRAVGAAKMVGGLAAKTVSAGLTPALTINSAYDSYNKPTKTYQAQTGIENGLGARTAGVMQDLGNALTGGLAGKAGDAISRWTSGGGAPAPAAPAATPTPAVPASAPQSGTIVEAPAAAPVPAAPVEAPQRPSLLADARASLEQYKTHKGDGNAWGEAADNKRNTAIGVQQANLSANEQQSQDSRYGSDLGYLSAAAGHRLGYAQLDREQYNNNAKQVDDKLRAMSTEINPKDNSSQFSPAVYAGHIKALNAALAESGSNLRTGDLNDDQMNSFMVAQRKKQKIDADNSGTLNSVASAVGLQGKHEVSDNPFSEAYTGTGVDKSSWLGQKLNTKSGSNNDTRMRTLVNTGGWGSPVDRDIEQQLQNEVDPTKRGFGQARGR